MKPHPFHKHPERAERTSSPHVHAASILPQANASESAVHKFNGNSTAIDTASSYEHDPVARPSHVLNRADSSSDVE